MIFDRQMHRLSEMIEGWTFVVVKNYEKIHPICQAIIVRIKCKCCVRVGGAGEM